MIAIIQEQDAHSRNVLSLMLTRLGYDTILSAANLNEIDYFIREYRERIELYVVGGNLIGELGVKLSKFAMEGRFSDHAPLILTRNPWLPISPTKEKPRTSRIDAYLIKPFGLPQLRTCISHGRRKRAESRSTLLVLGSSLATEAARAVLSCQEEIHWKAVIATEKASEFEEILSRQAQKVGAMVLHPAHCDPEFTHTLRQFKKSPLGPITPIVAMSRDPALIQPLHALCDLYFDPPGAGSSYSGNTMERAVTLLSRRVLYQFEVKEILAKTRHDLKSGSIHHASKWVRMGLDLDPDRWELLDQEGLIALKRKRVKEAITLFTRSLETNPCSPFAYLQLLDLLHGDERAEIARLAQLFCPAHPQIAAACLTPKAVS